MFCFAIKHGIYFETLYFLTILFAQTFLLESEQLNYHIRQKNHVTYQTNRQAPTKRPATTAAGAKTKKAKVAKARVVRPEKPMALNGDQWLTVPCV